MMQYKFTVNKLSDRKELGRVAAQEAAEAISALLKEKETINAIFAAAPSQNEFLEELAKSGVDFSRINAFHMDEYVGLPDDAPQRFAAYLREHIFSLVPFRSVNYLNGSACDAEAECERYYALLRENPVDIVFMGIGENGHIAFNDPHVADFNDPKLVKVVELDEKCRQQQVNDGCFAKIDDVPKRAMTLTIPALMAAGQHFCMVPGKTKCQAVHDTVCGPIGPHCPATAMRTAPDARLYIDGDSGRDL